MASCPPREVNSRNVEQAQVVALPCRKRAAVAREVPRRRIHTCRAAANMEEAARLTLAIRRQTSSIEAWKAASTTNRTVSEFMKSLERRAPGKDSISASVASLLCKDS